MSLQNSTTEKQSIVDLIERVKDSLTSIAGTARMAEEFIGDGNWEHDPDLKPWDKEDFLRGAFNQIFKEAGAAWSLIFDEFEEVCLQAKD